MRKSMSIWTELVKGEGGEAVLPRLLHALAFRVIIAMKIQSLSKEAGYLLVLYDAGLIVLDGPSDSICLGRICAGIGSPSSELRLCTL
jgi:hypothetical protein